MSTPPVSPSSLGFVHRFVPAAAGPASATGTLLLLHGTGGDENDLLPLGDQVAPGQGWNLLSPRGPVLENGMPRFFRRLAEGVFDEADLIRRAGELATFIGAAARHYRFDPGHVVALGYSNGANIAAAVLLLHPGTLAGAALLRAMAPLTPEKLPALGDAPVLLRAGRHDAIVPVENTARLLALLVRCGAQVTESWHPGGHELSPGDLQTASRWLSDVGDRFSSGARPSSTRGRRRC